jgi:hypothetical protein
MAKKAVIAPEELTAKIESYCRTYYLAQHSGESRRLEDEAQLEITATVIDISRRHRRFLGAPIEISLLTARSFNRSDERTKSAETAFLCQMNLRKIGCSCLAYLPSDAFWALPDMLRSGAVTHIQITFEPTRHGSGTLQSIYLAPEMKLKTI